MKRNGMLSAILFVLIGLSMGCGRGISGLSCDVIGPVQHAYDKAGPVPNGHILPNGMAITPAGDTLTIGLFPMNIVHIPSKDVLILTNDGRNPGGPNLQVIDLKTLSIKQTLTKGNLFIGLAISPDGSKLYAGGAAQNKVFTFDIDQNGLLSEGASITVSGFPGSLALSSNGKRLVVAGLAEDKVSIVNLESTSPTVDEISVGAHSEEFPNAYPYWVTLSKDEGTAYVSNWGEKSVSVIDLSSKDERKRISVGKNPEGMVLSPDGKTLYVANSDTDDISIIDTEKYKVTGKISVNFVSDAPYGATPTSLDMTEDGKYLFVSSAGTNSIDVISTYNKKVIGRIPTAWYPTRVLLGDGSIFVASAKGYGSGPIINKSEHVSRMNRGVLSIISQSDAFSNINKYTEQVVFNNNRLSTYYETPCRNLRSPVPARPGGHSPIKHVILIIRENKTYDQVLGDLQGTEADPTLIEYDETITPNTHKLAREYTNFDNCYADSEVSDQGHMWLTASISNDYVERSWLTSGRTWLPGNELASYPASDFFFHHLLKHNIKFMVYGEAVGTLPDLKGWYGREKSLEGYVDENWPGGVIWSMSPKDEDRAKYFAERIKEWEKSPNDMPSFILMLLPNDHTYGYSPGELTPESMVSDNDYGLGLVIETMSHSIFWPTTTIFVVEDDPQGGLDHIDAHRTVCLAIGPYVKRNYTSHVHYSFPSIYKTMELILGVPPMYQYDERAPAMYDVFTTVPDLTSYTALPRNIADEIVPQYLSLDKEMRKLARMSMKMDFTEPDSVKNHDMGYVLKRYFELKKKKSITPPTPLH